MPTGLTSIQRVSCHITCVREMRGAAASNVNAPRPEASSREREPPRSWTWPGPGGVVGPPELITVEQCLRRDIEHVIREIDLRVAAGQAASRELLGRLADREAALRARAEEVGGRVRPGAREPDGAGARAAGTGVPGTLQLLRARIGMFARGGVGGEDG